MQLEMRGVADDSRATVQSSGDEGGVSVPETPSGAMHPAKLKNSVCRLAWAITLNIDSHALADVYKALHS
jgi:hypothetical protein